MDEVLFSLDLGEGDSVAIAILPADDLGPASVELAVVGDGRFGVSVPMTLDQAISLSRGLSRMISEIVA